MTSGHTVKYGPSDKFLPHFLYGDEDFQWIPLSGEMFYEIPTTSAYIHDNGRRKVLQRLFQMHI